VFGGSRGYVTGLDVGTESVKAIRLQHTGDRVKLVGVALADIDYPSANRSDSDPEANAARVAAIRSALETSGTDISAACEVVTAVEGPSVSVKHVTFPKMPGPSLAESIGWEAKKHVPFGSSEFVLDFQLLPRESGDPENEMHVLLAAVEQRLIDSHVGLVVDAGVEPSAVDLVPLALVNELDEEDLLDDGAVAVVEMGVGTLSVSIYRDGGLLLVRSVRMPTRARGGEEESEDERAKWMAFVLKEVQRSLAFYNTETGRHGIERIYLSGGRALAEGVVDSFRTSLNIPTDVLNPFEGLAETGVDIEEFRSQGPRFALAMSLARRR
jgi:type IV pilus assembly protein PilM